MDDLRAKSSTNCALREVSANGKTLFHEGLSAHKCNRVSSHSAFAQVAMAKRI